MADTHPRDAAPSLSGQDLTDLDLFARGFPHDVFALHRREAPVWWHPATPHTPDGVGFWSVATHGEALTVFRDPATFSSVGGGERPRGGTIIPDTPTAGVALNMMDDPRHGRVRRLVSGAFAPRMIAQLEEQLRRRTCAILDALTPAGRCDFLLDVAAELPLQATCILLGVPEADRHRVGRWIDFAFDFEGRGYLEQTPEAQEAMLDLWRYGADLVTEKRRRPGSDMLSVVLHAELPHEDPSRLTEEEAGMFFTLLFAAGADTTRNATAGGFLELIRHPDTYVALAADPRLLPTAVEEMVRWTSPSAYNRRTATCDVTLRGHRIRAGDKVVVWEASANRDELVFPDAMTFDVRREPNPHLGFGHGVHFCLGANLARLEMRVILRETLARLTDVTLDGPVEYTRSNKHNGIRHMPVRFTPRLRFRRR
jgi:cytochrome P450